MSVNKVARNSFIIMITQAACAAMGMLGLFAISKMWGGHAPGIMGVVWFGFSFVGTFSFLTNLGFDAAHVKKISEGRDLGKCNGTYIAIKLMLTGILVLSVVSMIFIWKNVLHESFYDSTRESVIYLFIGYYVFFSLAQIPIMTFNSLKKNAKSQLAIFMDALVRVLLFIVIALAGISGALIVSESGTQAIDLPAMYQWPSFLQSFQTYISTHTIGAMSVAYMLGALSMFLAGMFLMRKFPVSRPDKEHMRMYLMFAIPMMIPVIFTLINTYLDKVILGYYWTSAEVGYYFAVQRISSFVMMIPAAIGIVLYPTISAMHSKPGLKARERNKGIAGLTKFSMRYTSMVTVPMVFIIIVLAVPLIDIILNSSFRPGTESLQILSIYTYLATMIIPYHFLVLGTNKPGYVARVFIVSGISNIVFNLMFIPRDGLLSSIGINGPTGAACATLLSAIIMFLGMYLYSCRIMKRQMFEKSLLLHLLAGVLAGAMMWKLGTFFDAIRWYHMLVLSLAGVGAYLVLLFGMGEFRKKELRFFLETINPLSLLRYVHDEVRDRK